MILLVIKITVYSTHQHASAGQTAEFPTNDQRGWGARHCRLRKGGGDDFLYIVPPPGCHDTGKPYCDILRYFFTVLRYIPFLIFSVKLNYFLNIRLNFELYVILAIESELLTCKHDCMKTFFKRTYVTSMHLLDLQFLQDKNWMKNKQFE